MNATAPTKESSVYADHIAAWKRAEEDRAEAINLGVESTAFRYTIRDDKADTREEKTRAEFSSLLLEHTKRVTHPRSKSPDEQYAGSIVLGHERWLIESGMGRSCQYLSGTTFEVWMPESFPA